LEQIVICSRDNDFAQCVCGDKVVVLNRIKRHTLNEVGVAEKFGVIPERLPEYLALVGDTSDWDFRATRIRPQGHNCRDLSLWQNGVDPGD
jgi:hypothetical protein